MKMVTTTKDARKIARNVALCFDEKPIGVFVKEDDFKKLTHKDEVAAITSLARQWTIEELQRIEVLFISYHRRIELLPIEINWERFFGNDNLVYLEVVDV